MSEPSEQPAASANAGTRTTAPPPLPKRRRGWLLELLVGLSKSVLVLVLFFAALQTPVRESGTEECLYCRTRQSKSVWLGTFRTESETRGELAAWYEQRYGPHEHFWLPREYYGPRNIFGTFGAHGSGAIRPALVELPPKDQRRFLETTDKATADEFFAVMASTNRSFSNILRQREMVGALRGHITKLSVSEAKRPSGTR